MRNLETTVHIQPTDNIFASTKVQIMGAFMLGAIIMFGVGFLPMDAVHNAAHDTRHSFAFPCH